MSDFMNISRDISGTFSLPSLSDGSTVLNDAINAFGHITSYGETITIAQFADMIEQHSEHIKAKALANDIRKIVEMILLVYKNDKAIKEDIVYKKVFAVANIDDSEAYVISLIKGDSFTRLNIDNSDKQLYSQLKTPEGGNFLAGHLNNKAA